MTERSDRQPRGAAASIVAMLCAARVFTAGTAASPPPDAVGEEQGGVVTPAQPPTSGFESAEQSSVAPDAEKGFADRIASGIVRLEANSGLRLGAAFTTLFQKASGPGDNRAAAAGDLDLLLKWNMIGRGTKNPGTLIFNSEYRFQIGDRPPSELAGEIGAGVATTNGFGERPVVVKELYWVQHLFDGAVRFGAGRAEPENLTAGHKLQSANTFFMHKSFSGNPAVAFPGAGLSFAGAVRPNDDWYLSAGAANAYGRTTHAEIDSLFEKWDLFSFAEAGWTPRFVGAGQGRYRVSLWRIDERDREGLPSGSEDRGISLIIDQDVGGLWRVFARAAWSDADSTGVERLVEGGVTYQGLLGSRSVTGAALSHVSFAREGRRDETVFEAFHRWQLTEFTQFTVGAQAIFDPADAPGDDALGVFSARLRITF